MQFTPETVWCMSDDELLPLLDEGLFRSEQKKINFYVPSFMYYKTSYYCSSYNDFPTISITGNGCALKCRHCGGKVLNAMYPVATPEKLFELCKQLKHQGASGCLISGGCLPNGSVPIGKYVDAIGKAKHELGMTVLVHTGLVDFQMAIALKKSGVDTALIDIIGSDETIKEICKLNVTAEDCASSLKALYDSRIAFVPHVIVGLHHGKLKGEHTALKMISKYKPSALVIIAFMPIHGTEMQDTEPPKPLDIARVMVAARLMLPNTPIALGCMRPKGEHRTETDILALKTGMDAIAFPTEEAIKYAIDHGYETVFIPACCSQISHDIEELAPSIRKLP